MNLLNRTVINFLDRNININGNWVNKYESQKRWEGQALSEEPMVSISFLECGNKITWVKSERNSERNHEINISIFNYDNIELDVQFNYRFNHGGAYFRSRIENINYFPKMYVGNISIGKISLICHFEGKPELKLYCLFVPLQIIKIGRNGIWHIRKANLNLIDNSFLSIFQYGRKGIINQ